MRETNASCGSRGLYWRAAMTGVGTFTSHKAMPRACRMPTGTVQVEDLGASGGVWVGDRSATRPVAVPLGAEIHLGDIVLRVEEAPP